MTIFYIPNPTQYLHLTTTLLLTSSKLVVYWGKSCKWNWDEMGRVLKINVDCSLNRTILLLADYFQK